jgi:tetratricopeptide (TPR) repeat protein
MFYEKTGRQANKLKKFYAITASIIIISFTVTAIYVFSASNSKKISNNEKKEILNVWNQGNFEQAYKLSSDALTAAPLDYFLLTINGFSAFQLGISQINNQNTLIYIDGSVISLRKALLLKESARDGRVNYVLGKAYFYKGDKYSDLAVKYLEKAKVLGYEANDIPEFLGLSYAATGDYRESVEAFSQALSPQVSDNLLLSIARSYIELDDYEIASGYLLRCIDTTPDSKSVSAARFMLAEIYIKTGEHEHAEKMYNAILSDSGENAEAHYQLGELYSLKGDATRARSEWRLAYRQNPAHEKARARLNI